MSLGSVGEERRRRRLEAKIELSEQETKSIEEMSREELILELKKARKEILIQKRLKENAIRHAQSQEQPQLQKKKKPTIIVLYER